MADFTGFRNKVLEMTRAPSGFASAYEAGRDCGLHGANLVNCHFGWFRSQESTAEWERGKREGGGGGTDVTS